MIYRMLLTFSLLIFAIGCGTSKMHTHPDYGVRTSKQIDSTKSPPDILEVYENEKNGVITHLRNGYLVKQVVPDAITRQLLKDAHAVRAKLNALRAPDGSIPAVTEALLESLHNPDSFQHIETTILLVEHKYTYHVLVRVHYRATNAFNALIKTSNEFRFNTKGNLVSAN